MEFFKKTSQIDFMGQKKAAMIFSIIILIVSVLSLTIKGLNLGLDFTGGTQIEIKSSKPLDQSLIRKRLIQNKIDDITIQSFGSNKKALIRIGVSDTKNQDQLKKLLAKILNNNTEIVRLEYIGPQVGSTLLENGILAIIISLVITMIYIAIRFEIRFALSAAISLIHDPVLILGVFSFYQLEFNLIALAALLTILGYSLNDTIVVYDRVRENFKLHKNKTPSDIINLSINQTLSRTLITSGLTLLVVLALCLLGGSTLKDFSIALIIGIIIGTYSSIYIAGSLAVTLGLSRESLLPRKKSNALEV